MRSIERNFSRISKKNPFLSSYVCFAEAVKGKNYSRDRIRKQFNKLVNQEDYIAEEKPSILKHLYKLTTIEASVLEPKFASKSSV